MISIKRQKQRDVPSSQAPLKVLVLRPCYQGQFTMVDTIRSRLIDSHESASGAQPEQSPSDCDIALSADKGGFRELTMTAPRFLGECTKHQFIEPDVTRRHNVGKTLSIFSDVDVIIFEVDISAYDGKVREREMDNGIGRDAFVPLLDHAAGRFQRIRASLSESQTPILLVLKELTIFREKIREKPLDLYYPKYKSGMDGTSAADCIKHRMLSSSKTVRHKSIKGIFLDGDDPDFASKLTKELSTLHVDHKWRQNGII